MAAATAARPWASALLLLVLLAVSLHSSEAQAGNTVNLCGRSPPGEFCNINCLVPDPVCGVDGVTYTCGCPEADCKGVPVVKLGPC